MSQTSDTAAAPRPGRRRLLWIALIASLAVNAVFAGIALRTLWHVRNASFMSAGGIERRLPRFIETLPSERRASLRQSDIIGNTVELRPLRQELRQARAEAVRVFTADPFDKGAFMAADARLAQAENQLRRAIRARLSEIGETLTFQERRALLQWMRPGGRGGRSRRNRSWRRDRDGDAVTSPPQPAQQQPAPSQPASPK